MATANFSLRIGDGKHDDTNSEISSNLPIKKYKLNKISQFFLEPLEQ